MLSRVQRELYENGLAPQQAIMIMEIGDTTLPAGEIHRRGFYAGSNVSYNLKILCEKGFLKKSQVKGDRRKVLISLTERGLDLCIRLRRSLADMQRKAA